MGCYRRAATALVGSGLAASKLNVAGVDVLGDVAMRRPHARRVALKGITAPVALRLSTLTWLSPRRTSSKSARMTKSAPSACVMSAGFQEGSGQFRAEGSINNECMVASHGIAP